MMSAPAWAKAAASASTGCTIRCARPSGAAAVGALGVQLERLAHHGAEREVGHVVVVHHVKVIQSAPAAITSATSGPKRAKSADKIEGAMR